MSEPDPVWPPAPMRTDRLALREPEARDRPALVELLSSPEVGTYVGGSRPRDAVERELPDPPARRPGLWVVEHDRATIGIVTLDPRDPDRSEPVLAGIGELELGYLFLPASWGRGLATEACTAALRWFDDAHPGEPLSLCTQTANAGSMRVAAKLGFAEVARFEAYGAEQWLGVRRPQRTRRSAAIPPNEPSSVAPSGTKPFRS
ncbi:MAG TPA: GNAT family N-acetyltransferase [Luteimicrobium sp.]|nr:GNAT family N-acetyltransferase [Luteimicrobium sp.]